ncbi:MAG: dockerin type I repeat-containing protein [Phycisphaerales bacterium]|nr:dockerin type I repeat-containing protein [Phycisphaerales bacterium]
MLKSVFAITAVLGSSSVGLAQGRMDLPSWGGWGQRPCTRMLLHAYVVPFDCGDVAQFLQKRWIPKFMDSQVSTSQCCAAVDITSGKKWSVGGEGAFNVCGVEQKVKADYGGETAERLYYTDHLPCGCAQVTWEQDYQVYHRERELVGCDHERFYETDTMIKKVPNGGRWRPYYYSPSTPCQGCTTANRRIDPAQPAAPAYDPTFPGGFPMQPPNNMPQPVAIPWNPAVHGNPDFDGLTAPRGKDKQATISMVGEFAPRKIRSSLSLTLYECREIVLAVNERREAPALLGDDSWVTVEVAAGVTLQGPLADLVSGVIKYADGMFKSKEYGDFNKDGVRDSTDYAMLVDAITSPLEMPEYRWYDLDGDGLVTQADLLKWTELVTP